MYRVVWINPDGQSEELFCETKELRDETMDELEADGLEYGWEKV